MKALIVYESMYGNTHVIADRIGEGLRRFGDVTVVPVGGASPELVAAADLLVVGGPTHVHGMTSSRSRRAAAEAASKPGSDLVVDPAAQGPGLRDWFDSLVDGAGRPAAAFDTRMEGPAVFTGQASRGISKRLRRRHYRLVSGAESFLVGKDNHPLGGSESSARAWGELLAEKMGWSPSIVHQTREQPHESA